MPVLVTAGYGGEMDDDGVFDERVAAGYDADSSRMFAPEVLGPTLDVLERLAHGGRVLEFASGTGRVALPLAERGLDVSGIELSRAMTERLKAKPGADKVTVAIGDMTSTRVDGQFSLVYLVFNTIGNVLSQDGQVEVFRNAAAHLEPGGRFVVELFIPELRRLLPGDTRVLFSAEEGYVGYDEYDVVGQQLVSVHTSVTGEGAGSVFKTPQRFVWPAELDLMARLAGMTLESRWADWDGSDFTAESESHVSVWVKD